MNTFYLLVIIFFALVLYDGFDSTIKLISYIDTKVRHKIVEIEMWFIRKRIESDPEFIKINKLIQEKKKFNGR